MAKSHKIEYGVGSNPQGTSSQKFNETYYDDSGTPVPQIQSTDIGKFLKAGSSGPSWDSVITTPAWGSITGTITDQTDLITYIGQQTANFVTTNTAQTIVESKTWAVEGNALSTAVGTAGITETNRIDSTHKYEARVQSGSFRTVYATGSGTELWSGVRLMAPTTPATDPVSKINHFVTRNDAQTTYTLQLPEKNGTLAVEKEWTKILDNSTGGVQFGFNLSGYSEFCMMVYTTNTSDAQLLLHYGASSNVWMASITGSENTNVLYKHYVNGPVVPECVCSETSVSVSSSATMLFGPTVPAINGISITSGSISMITLYAR